MNVMINNNNDDRNNINKLVYEKQANKSNNYDNLLMDKKDMQIERQSKIIETLRKENSELKLQVEKYKKKLAEYESCLDNSYSDNLTDDDESIVIKRVATALPVYQGYLWIGKKSKKKKTQNSDKRSWKRRYAVLTHTDLQCWPDIETYYKFCGEYNEQSNNMSKEEIELSRSGSDSSSIVLTVKDCMPALKDAIIISMHRATVNEEMNNIEENESRQRPNQFRIKASSWITKGQIGPDYDSWFRRNLSLSLNKRRIFYFATDDQQARRGWIRAIDNCCKTTIQIQTHRDRHDSSDIHTAHSPGSKRRLERRNGIRSADNTPRSPNVPLFHRVQPPNSIFSKSARITPVMIK